MCGRYYLDEEIKNERLIEQIRQAMRVSVKLCANMKISGEIRPTDTVPALAPSAIRRNIGAFPMQWGFMHPKHKVLVFNTRSERAEKQDMFCASVDDRRCLIPASGYYEWKKGENGKKDRYAFFDPEEEPLYLAGLYIRSSEQKVPCFSILTQDAVPGIKEIHLRMPVLVPYDRAEEWLSPDTDFKSMIKSLQPAITAEKR